MNQMLLNVLTMDFCVTQNLTLFNVWCYVSNSLFFDIEGYESLPNV